MCRPGVGYSCMKKPKIYLTLPLPNKLREYIYIVQYNSDLNYMIQALAVNFLQKGLNKPLEALNTRVSCFWVDSLDLLLNIEFQNFDCLWEWEVFKINLKGNNWLGGWGVAGRRKLSACKAFPNLCLQPCKGHS